MFEFEAKLEIKRDNSLGLDKELSLFDQQLNCSKIKNKSEKFIDNFLILDTIKNFKSLTNLFFLFSFENLLFQEDCYYNHPSWDYKKENMALRNRKEILFQCNDSLALENKISWEFLQKHSLLTFKNKTIDSAFKLRKEYEFEVNNQLWQVLEENGFTKALCVRKKRYFTKVNDSEFKNFSLAFDLVFGLGIYLEIEVMLNLTDPEEEKASQEFNQKMQNFLYKYNLQEFKKEDTSYLGLLLKDKC